jgi:hypothetical protein
MVLVVGFCGWFYGFACGTEMIVMGMGVSWADFSCIFLFRIFSLGGGPRMNKCSFFFG